MMTTPSTAQPIRHSFQTTDGVTLSFLEAGSEHGNEINIVLVPGWLMPGRIWQNQINDFSRTYHTLAFDPRGQGESQVAASGYTAERRATDLNELLLKRSSVLLVGWSLGGIEALQYVHMFGADHLAGLVLVDSLMEEPALKAYHLLPSVRGDLLFKLGRHAEARAAFECAAALTGNRREQEFLRRRAAACSNI